MLLVDGVGEGEEEEEEEVEAVVDCCCCALSFGGLLNEVIFFNDFMNGENRVSGEG